MSTDCIKGRVMLRGYQRRIADECAGQNSIVVLPTGSGKTMIASEIILEIIRRQKGQALFLVPTRFLVPQQAAAVRAHTGLDVGEYFGGEKLPSSFDVLVSTPKAFETVVDTGQLAWDAFSCIVFDEVHHVLKDHPYRKLAQSLRQSGTSAVCLGLTASLSYAVGDAKVKKSVTALCAELNVSHLADAEKEELQRDGYHPPDQAPDVRVGGCTPDPVGTLPAADRKPHLMIHMFWCRIDGKKATPFSQSLVHLIGLLEGAVKQAHPTFTSPLRKPGGVKLWGEFAHRHMSAELIGHLEPWYEALRILVVSWEEAEDAATMMLRMSRALEASWPASTMKEINAFAASLPKTFPQFEKLKCALAEHVASRGESFRGIVFVQQRVTTHILYHVIASDPDLSAKLNPVCLYSTSAPATPSLAISKRQAEDYLAKFAAGSSNLLIATVVAEEGMDIPAANVVVRYDVMHHATSLVQSRGRGRQAGSDFIVLNERCDRTVQDLLEAEQQQAETIRNYTPPSANSLDNTAATAAQKSRERGANHLLAKDVEGSNSLAVLNEYCRKTKVSLCEDFSKDEFSWCCVLTYTSMLRTKIATGKAISKKSAKKESAKELLKLLRLT